MSIAATPSGSISRYRTIDLVTIATLGVAFGAVYWGWGKMYAWISEPVTVAYPPTAALFGGVWLIAGVVGGLIVRKPGAALATELIAAAVSLLIVGGTEWGVSTLASGFFQGLGVELVLAVLLYRRFGVMVAAAAGAVAGAFESIYEWGAYYADWNFGYKLMHLGFFALSGAVIAGAGGWLLVRALARAGVLDTFGPGREHARKA